MSYRRKEDVSCVSERKEDASNMLKERMFVIIYKVIFA